MLSSGLIFLVLRDWQVFGDRLMPGFLFERKEHRVFG